MQPQDLHALLHIDEWNLPCKRQDDGTLDGGDSGHNYYTLAYCGLRLLPPEVEYELLIDASGWPLRHPNSAKWYGRPGRCSRDLLTPALVFAARHDSALFKRILRAMRQRWYVLADNHRPNFRYDTPQEHAALSTPDVPFEPQRKLPDILGPDIWSICLRGFARQHVWLAPLVWPLLNVLDMHGLVNALKSHVSDEVDLRNSTLKLHFSAHVLPTPVSWLAWHLYKLSNPQAKHVQWWTQAGEPAIHLWILKLFA